MLTNLVSDSRVNLLVNGSVPGNFHSGSKYNGTQVISLGFLQIASYYATHTVKELESPHRSNPDQPLIRKFVIY
jgi:hypothetical protein